MVHLPDNFCPFTLRLMVFILKVIIGRDLLIHVILLAVLLLFLFFPVMVRDLLVSCH